MYVCYIWNNKKNKYNYLNRVPFVKYISNIIKKEKWNKLCNVKNFLN